MHPYSLDNKLRKCIYIVISCISISVPIYFDVLINFLGFEFISFTLTFGITFSILFFLVDKYLWKIFKFVNMIPNLEGKWNVIGNSSFKDEHGENYKFNMEIEIKQTLTSIEIFAETENSTSKSTMASIEMNHSKAIFRYTFENTPKNMSNDELQRHPGMIQLRINSNEDMSGDYFSGKHRLRYGELKLKKVNK